MPQKVLTTNEAGLKSIPLPTHGGKYATVSHGFIIDTVKQELEDQGFTIKEETYRSNLNGEVAQGIYYLNFTDTMEGDDEIGLMFAWANSYDKTMRFRCAIGGYVFVCGNGIIAGDMSNYGRKHVGDAKDEVKAHIKGQITKANDYYKQLVEDKKVMKNITLTEDQRDALLGRLFLRDEVLTSSQLIICKDQLSDPAHDYGTTEDSLWTLYNHITYSLKQSHPKRWMEDQKDLHKIVSKVFIPKPEVDPNQTNLIDLINVADETIEEELQVVEDNITENQEVTLTEESYDEDPTEEVIETAEEIKEEPSFSLDDYLGIVPQEEIIEELKAEEPEPEPQTDKTGLLKLTPVETEAILETVYEETLEEDVVEVIAETMVEPLKSDEPLPLSELNTEQLPTEDVETDWEISSETEEPVQEITIVNEPINIIPEKEEPTQSKNFDFELLVDDVDIEDTLEDSEQFETTETKSNLNEDDSPFEF